MRLALLWLLFAGCGHDDSHQLYRRGMLDYQLGRYDQAITAFSRAYHISGAPALLYDLAQAYRLKHAPEKALPLYRAYLRLDPHAANRAEVERRIVELKTRLVTR